MNVVDDSQKLDDKNFIREKLYGEEKSSFKRYSELVIGDLSYWRLIRYELVTGLLGSLPGALGIILRKLFYPFLFRKVGRGVIFGRNLVIRHPHRIDLENGVVLDDNCLIDARGAGEDGINIGDRTIVNRGTTIQAKIGPIRIGADTSIGGGSSIVAQGGIDIGDMVNFGGGCYISGGIFDLAKGQDSDRGHDKYTRGPIRIGRKCRFGMRSVVLDGVQVGEGSIVGAMSLVNNNLPEYVVAAGVPAKVLKNRLQDSSGS